MPWFDLALASALRDSATPAADVFIGRLGAIIGSVVLDAGVKQFPSHEYVAAAGEP